MKISYLQPSRELQLLLQLMQEKAALPPSADRQRFFQLAQKNRMMPVVAERLTDGVPEYDADGEAALVMRQVTVLGRLARLFGEKGIRFLAVKGPAMALDVYGSLLLRCYHDLDVLVEVQKVDQAVEVLRQDGWEWYEASSLTTPKRLAESKKWQHHYLFMKGDLFIELHWRLLPWDTDAFDELWNNRRTLMLGGEELTIPGRMDQICHQIIHNTRHGYHRLKWLTDMVQLMPVLCENMDVLWQQLHKDGQELMLLVTVMLLQRLAVLDVPAMCFSGIRFAREMDGVVAEADGKQIKLVEKAMALTDELLPLMEGLQEEEYSSGKMHYARQLPHALRDQNLVTRWVDRLRPRPWLWEWVNLPDGLYFLYWLLRIIHKLWKTLSGK